MRLQCYQGINEEKAIGQYDREPSGTLCAPEEQEQPDTRLGEIKREMTSREYFIAGPLLEAIEQDIRAFC